MANQYSASDLAQMIMQMEAKQPIGVVSSAKSNVLNPIKNTPTVPPPKTVWQNVSDFLKVGADIAKTGVDVYSKIQQAKEPTMATVQPTIIYSIPESEQGGLSTLRLPSPLSIPSAQAQEIGREILPSNTIVIGAEKGTQGAQQVTPQPQTQSNNLTTIVIVSLIALLGLAILLRGKRGGKK